MKTNLKGVLILSGLIAGLLLYRGRGPGSDLSVTPDAARQIEGAKRR